ncbi:MAG: hypothetical protein H6563_02980 [Lewinellaceae bacterium]|nr:hypothetical protein [Lewinellaceae bacterium]
MPEPLFNPRPVTLQISLSPGDIRYAHLTVPHLLRMHPYLEKRMLVVDCRPQKTKIFDPDKKNGAPCQRAIEYYFQTSGQAL